MKVKLVIFLMFILFALNGAGYHRHSSGKPGLHSARSEKKLSSTPFSIFRFYSPVFRFIS